MKPVNELINNTDPAWPLVQEWIAQATNKTEILSRDSLKANEALYKTQVTTRSPMGAIIYETGGILVDNGWIRILGSGSPRLNRSLPDWNKGKSFEKEGAQPGFLLVADDVIGGFFAINGGALGNDPGKIYYMAPDNLNWEPLDLSYSDFLSFCFSGNLKEFYASLRWTGWEKDVAALDGNVAYSCFPFLWTEEGQDINKVSRKVIPVEEQYHFSIDMQKKLGNKP